MVRWIVIVLSVAATLPVKSADAPRTQSTNKVAVPQPPPLPQPPIALFRQLLSMKSDEREKALAVRPPNTRELLKQKLAEYDALPADVRENRLRTLELQWYLRPLMKASPTNRAAQLQTIPERDRELIAARLKSWDALPADQQSDILKSELAMRVFFRPEKGLITYPGLPMNMPQQHERIRESIKHLNSLPPEKRQRIYRNFGDFFELSEQEKAKALDTLSDTERRRMERTLQDFEKLPPQDRDRCIAGFQKFSALPPAELAQFLKNAERWQAMSKQDREVWRSLVIRKAVPMPPLPPGLTNPGAAVKRAELHFATNN